MSKLWCVPDIHGRKDLLDQLLKKLFEEEGFNFTEDKLIFLGDMIDRGKDSKGVLDTIRELTEEYPENVIALAGNHEWLMIDGCVTNSSRRYNDDWDLWLANGAYATLDSFPFNKVPDEYIKWCASLPLYHEEPGFFFSHAPIAKEAPKDSALPFSKDSLIWTYVMGDEAEWTHKHENAIGVCGHIHRLNYKIMEPRFYDHYYFLDCGSGCKPNAPLVAVEVNSKDVIYSWPKDLNKERE